MQTKDRAHTTRRITILVIASLVLGGCLSTEEQTEGLSGGQSVNTPTNSAPVISGNPSTTVNVGGFYSFVPTASDADGDALTFSIENKPAWESFDAGTGELSGQPTLGDVGIYENIRISVTDGADSVTLQPSLSINVCPPGEEANCGDPTPPAYNDEDGPLGDGTGIGDLTVTSNTFHSIGVVWDIDGDENHNAEVTVRYRKVGAAKFSDALPLIRNDYAWFWESNYPPAQPAINNFAGSIMFLSPGTEYELVFELTDPDGGRAIRVENITTRAIPVKPTGGNTYYVIPDAGGSGDGSSGNPFQGLAEANTNAAPGDRFLLRSGPGTYAKATLTTSGAENNWIVYEQDPDDPGAVIDAIGIKADHLWIDHLTFVWNDPTGGATPAGDQSWTDTSAIYRAVGADNPDDIIISNNSISGGYFNGVYASGPITRWVVTDNDLVGPHPAGVGGDDNYSWPYASDGKGINLGGEGQWGRSSELNNVVDPPNCIIAFNNVTRFSDQIGLYEDTDLYGNRVYDGRGNAASTDDAYQNVRVWGNILQYSWAWPLSFQVQRQGPWYFLYNQIGQAIMGPMKFLTLDRNVFVNNTVVQGVPGAEAFMKWYMRNNLFYQPNGTDGVWGSKNLGPPLYNVSQFTADWTTDIDYDGFAVEPTAHIFRWFDPAVRYDTVADWSAAVGGAEANGIRLDRNSIFEDPTLDPFNSMELAAGTNAAVGAGTVVPNLSDFHGGTPDLGAHQREAPPLHYGPRPGYELIDKPLYWDRH